MEIGVGTPATIPGTPGEAIVDWARHADGTTFSSLGIIDRIAYPNHEPLATLAVFSGATTRVRLMPTVMVAPIRQTGLLAKQAATIDSLSGGRLTLALGIGGRDEDYRAAGSSTEFSDRAPHLEEQITTMRRIWRGEPPGDDVAPIGPRPVSDGGPQLLVGGYSEPAARRAGRMGDGFIAGTLTPADARDLYDTTLEAWEEEGREGRPRFVGCAYWGLGSEGTLERGRNYLRDYYGWSGTSDRAAEQMLTGAGAIRERLHEAHEVGMDEYILWPTVADLDQLDRLHEVVVDAAG